MTIRSGVGELSLELDFSMQACYPRPSETGSLATAQRLRVRSGCAGSPSQITQVQQRAIGSWTCIPTEVLEATLGILGIKSHYPHARVPSARDATRLPAQRASDVIRRAAATYIPGSSHRSFVRKGQTSVQDPTHQTCDSDLGC